MPAQPSLNPQIIGQAESALGAIMDPILADTGTTFPQWLVLTVLAGNGGVLELGALVARITNARKVDADLVLGAIRQLAADGLVAESPGQASLTAAGRSRQSQVGASITAITGRLFGGFAPDELETAGRVLSIVTERANVEIARMAS